MAWRILIRRKDGSALMDLITERTGGTPRVGDVLEHLIEARRVKVKVTAVNPTNLEGTIGQQVDIVEATEMD
jgi:hypothetical protein